MHFVLISPAVVEAPKTMQIIRAIMPPVPTSEVRGEVLFRQEEVEKHRAADGTAQQDEVDQRAAKGEEFSCFGFHCVEEAAHGVRLLSLFCACGFFLKFSCCGRLALHTSASHRARPVFLSFGRRRQEALLQVRRLRGQLRNEEVLLHRGLRHQLAQLLFSAPPAGRCACWGRCSSTSRPLCCSFSRAPPPDTPR